MEQLKAYMAEHYDFRYNTMAETYELERRTKGRGLIEHTRHPLEYKKQCVGSISQKEPAAEESKKTILPRDQYLLNEVC